MKEGIKRGGEEDMPGWGRNIRKAGWSLGLKEPMGDQ